MVSNPVGTSGASDSARAIDRGLKLEIRTFPDERHGIQGAERRFDGALFLAVEIRLAGDVLDLDVNGRPSGQAGERLLSVGTWVNPPSDVAYPQRFHLVQAKLAHQAATVGGPRDVGIVHHHGDVVGGHPNVELHHFCPDGHRFFERS